MKATVAPIGQGIRAGADATSATVGLPFISVISRSLTTTTTTAAITATRSTTTATMTTRGPVPRLACFSALSPAAYSVTIAAPFITTHGSAHFGAQVWAR